ncbi:MAG: adenosylmethionine decarboxylase [Candidatus Competibacterales bacterium]|nr:adenosylmethionine decarboxylase [Candidatus Competibacterales bacterium]
MHANPSFAAVSASAPANKQALTLVEAGRSAGSEDQDHFIQRDGKCFAGSHLILDFWGAGKLDQLDLMERALRAAVEAAGATLLHIHLHHFTPNGGISGVAVLAESHISVHTWPERDYAAFDIFMCGDAEPARAIPVLTQAFRPRRMICSEHLRGVVDDAQL